jgi:peptidoglycan hydrolase FlgJ
MGLSEIMNPLTNMPIDLLRGQDQLKGLESRVSGSGDSKAANKAELEKVAKEFDAIFVRQILKEMRRSVMRSSLFGSAGGAQGIYEDMFDDQMADALSEAGGFGLGEIVARDLEMMQNRLSGSQLKQILEKNELPKVEENLDPEDSPFSLPAGQDAHFLQLEMQDEGRSIPLDCQ